MNTRTLLALPFLLVLILATACQTTPTMHGDGALAEASGIWRFSHPGKPTIQSGDVDVPKIVAENMQGSKISIAPDGKASMLAVGQSKSFDIVVVEETPLFIKLGLPEDPEKAYTYDKATRLLSLPMPLDIDGDEGTISAYYKRQR